ncbi:hypothetical protein BDP27DRAFT_1453066 [Rhodocollybia butyracea]|uniref:Ubiquitin-like domain-containing protein n=1 Tax=Rhodocollybia butyracea TaxID=206335 RepID=A0A9P5PAF5_9AGAR|nr:hypothetical protein BDP27DRAFT_1453066 [Rhodocollybia butyracea]
MPKDTTRPITRSYGKRIVKKDEPTPPCVVFTHKTRQITLPKSLLESHAEATRLVRDVFQLNHDGVEIIFETSDLPECDDGVKIEVPSVTWTYVLPGITRISVVTREVCRDPLPLPLIPASNAMSFLPRQGLVPVAPPPTPLVKPAYIALNMTYEATTISFKVRENADLDKCLGKLGMEDGDEVLVYTEQTGGKPVIYVFPPAGREEMDVSVCVSLVPQWKFSAVYPVVSVQPNQLKKSPGECITWDVCMHRDQTMTEKSTDLTVSYLYWEAATQGLAPSPPDSPCSREQQSESERFDPISSDLSDNDNVSVVLPLSRITPYLDAALKVLGLHTEARTSFITYWLPSFNKHTHIALRFVSQHLYERAAPLNVLPKPDVVVRVFILFKGVPELDVEGGIWGNATAREADGAERWRDVVGLDARDKLSDTLLFRVLEWGGMEVRR